MEKITDNQDKIKESTFDKVQDRRTFFLSISKSVLPGLALLGLGMVTLSGCEKCDGCEASCEDDCESTCLYSCTGSCSSSCTGTCDYTCTGSCQGLCGNACTDNCDSGCYGCTQLCHNGCTTSCTGGFIIS